MPCRQQKLRIYAILDLSPLESLTVRIQSIHVAQQGSNSTALSLDKIPSIRIRDFLAARFYQVENNTYFRKYELSRYQKSGRFVLEIDGTVAF